jgi:[methyl-Co(III) methanol-specific corrinoid protein]:coenzyme M methyltransferase
MTPRQRFLAGLRGEPTDRTPVAHVAALTTVQLQEATGCYMPAVHHDPEKLVRLMAANHEILGLDAVTFLINFFNEPAALGAEIEWGDRAQLPRVVSHPWRNVDDARVVDDFLQRKPVTTCLETLQLAKRDYGERIAVLGKVMGPLSMIQMMHGVENVLFGMVDEPQRIHRFLEVAVEMLVDFANAQFDIGIDALMIGEGGAGAQMMSPAMYQEFLLPIHQQMIQRIKGPTVMHICGDISARFAMLRQTGLTCFNFDWAIPPPAMVEAAAGSFTVMGNVNTADLLNAEPAEIERQVHENLAAGVHIISPGCAISPRCTNRNLQAMVHAVDQY